MTEQPCLYALSIKQPWAALVVLGLKTIEVRRWPTARRGRVLIHAARVCDDRPEAWRHVREDATELAQLRGGIIGAVELTDCVSYKDLPTFLVDRPKHLNEPGWFEPPQLYGFTFAEPAVLPFEAYPGWFRFFKVPSAIQTEPTAAAAVGRQQSCQDHLLGKGS